MGILPVFFDFIIVLEQHTFLKFRHQRGLGGGFVLVAGLVPCPLEVFRCRGQVLSLIPLIITPTNQVGKQSIGSADTRR